MQDAVLSEGIPAEKTTSTRETVGILVEDPTYRRLLEGIARHLELTPQILTADDLRSDTVLQFDKAFYTTKGISGTGLGSLDQ